MDIKATLNKAWQGAKINGNAAYQTVANPKQTMNTAGDFWGKKLNDVMEYSIDALTPQADPNVQRKGIGWDPDALTPAQLKNLRRNAR